MTALRPPPIEFKGRTWTSEELYARVVGWWEEARHQLSPLPSVIAVVLANDPDVVALFLALSALPVPIAVLSNDARSWRSSPVPPVGTPLVLHPAFRELAREAEGSGYRAVVLRHSASARAGADGPSLFASPGVVLFTSGSTGPPKPVYRLTATTFRVSSLGVEALGLRPGDGILGALPLSSSHGLTAVLYGAMQLGSPIGLVERFDHRPVLALFASERYRYFPCTPVMADILSRCPLSGPPPPAPEHVRVGAGRMPESVSRAFIARFGVAPRGAYGSTESGIIAVDASPPGAIRPTTVGRPLPGIDVRIGDDPLHPLPTGTPGRIWFTSPVYMQGYGFPPELEPLEQRDGWWPTADLGALDETGYLALLGRVDDCFKTAAGRLINPAHMAEVIAGCSGVVEAQVVLLPHPGGVAIGLVVAGAGVTADAVRAHAGRSLPPWSWPEIIRVTRALPRLPGGKVDRAACVALLGGAPGDAGVGASP